jgi:hypothetical protein
MVLVGGPGGVESVTLDEVQDPDQMRRGKKGRGKGSVSKGKGSLPGNPTRQRGSVRRGGRGGR